MTTTPQSEAPSEAPPETPPGTRRRTDGLVGNGLVLLGVLLYLSEFIGIIGSHVHVMPTLPGSSAHHLTQTYHHQSAVTGFLVGWYSLVLPGRILIVAAMRQSLLASDRDGRLGASWRSLLSWAIALMSLGVALELVADALLAGAAATSARGYDDATFALDRAAHYAGMAVDCPYCVALVIVGVAMWRVGTFPRVLAALLVATTAINALNGALLTAPSTAGLQDALSGVLLLTFVLLIWLGVLTFRHRPSSSSQEARA